MNVLDLFSGIGGFSLGLERAGMRTVAFCEIEPFCRAVLRKHWPNVPIYEDIRELTADRLRADGISVDVVAGGFPCQDISIAGKGEGIEGSRSGLWSEQWRLTRELRPKIIVVENVTALLGRGLDRVLGDLAEIGYDAEWHCIPASAAGAPHRRDRLWLMAHPRREPNESGRVSRDGSGETSADQGDRDQRQRFRPETSDGGQDVADADRQRLERWLRTSLQECSEEWLAGERGSRWIGGTWITEPAMGRVAHGVPNRVDRLKALGNAVVPQIPEIIGRAIMQTLND